MSDWNQRIIEEFRANGGVVGGTFEGRPLLLLHHIGAKSGVERVSPLMYQSLDGGYAIFGSKGGADTNPDWFHNVVANPDIEVEVGSDNVAVRARIVEGDERSAIWEPWKSRFQFFAEYEQKTSRRIPVIVLEPR
jgi:deazaflavin-dependent oxidoreductase (nitroreductase family)